jgi:hypothetical protein
MISAFPSMTNRNARRSGTIVNGSNEAFSARQPTIKHSSLANPPKYTTPTTPSPRVALATATTFSRRRSYSYATTPTRAGNTLLPSKTNNFQDG